MEDELKDDAGITTVAHLLIRDKGTGEVLLAKRDIPARPITVEQPIVARDGDGRV